MRAGSPSPRRCSLFRVLGDLDIHLGVSDVDAAPGTPPSSRMAAQTMSGAGLRSTTRACRLQRHPRGRRSIFPRGRALAGRRLIDDSAAHALARKLRQKLRYAGVVVFTALWAR